MSPDTARTGRLPFAVVERYLHTDTVTHTNRRGQDTHLARRLKVSRTQIYRWRTIGVTWVQADEIATHLGVWPGNLFPDWADTADRAANNHHKETET